MPAVGYTTTIELPRTEVWRFVQDINNWAPLVKGYQGHESINERESVWTIKGDVGPFSRMAQVHVRITEWVDGERVAFTMEGTNEPVTGGGAIQLRDAESGGG